MQNSSGTSFRIDQIFLIDVSPSGAGSRTEDRHSVRNRSLSIRGLPHGLPPGLPTLSTPLHELAGISIWCSAIEVETEDP